MQIINNFALETGDWEDDLILLLTQAVKARMASQICKHTYIPVGITNNRAGVLPSRPPVWKALMNQTSSQIPSGTKLNTKTFTHRLRVISLPYETVKHW